MSQTVHCVRQPSASSGGAQTVNVSAYSVFAVLLGRFHAIDERHDAIFAATSNRLRDILTEIAEPAHGRSPGAIDLVWANVSEIASRRPNERAVYFVQSYREGIIHPYAAHMQTRASSEARRAYFADLERAYLGPGAPSGLTLEDREQAAPRMLSEVHIDRLMFHYPDVNNAGHGRAWQEAQWADAGRGMGGMAFHELMHAVVDLNESAGFDLHDHGDIANVDGFAATPSRANLQRFARFMLRPTPAQIVTTGRHPRIPMPTGGANAQSASDGPDLSNALQGL